jgi:thiol-disulfide isomerase/thioredoxin
VTVPRAIALLVLVGLAWPATTVQATGEESELLERAGSAVVGEPAPWLSGWTLDGAVWNTRMALGRPEVSRLALVFWASWCVPCRTGIDRLRDAKDTLADAGVSVILVNVGERESQVHGFFDDGPSPWPVLLDPHGRTCETWIDRGSGDCTLPLTAIVVPDGTVVSLIGAEGADYVGHVTGVQ